MAEKIQLPALTWRSRAKGLAHSLLNFVFPPVCGACKKAGSLLCAGCYAQLRWVEEPICRRCGRPLPKVATSCSLCQQRPLSLEQVRTAVLFDYPVSKLIHKLKYNGAFGLANPLAEMMIMAWPKWRTPVDLVLPIPLHAERKRHRGYNQSALLARAFSEQSALLYSEDALQRTRFTTPQVGLSATQRLENVQDAFVANDLVRDKHVLLIDDVYTTGATLAAAASALLAAGAKKVSGYCAARAV